MKQILNTRYIDVPAENDLQPIVYNPGSYTILHRFYRQFEQYTIAIFSGRVWGSVDLF